MGWGKILAGASVGFLFGGPLGAIAGAATGAAVNKNTETKKENEKARSTNKSINNKLASQKKSVPITEKNAKKEEEKKVVRAQKKRKKTVQNISENTEAIQVQTIVALAALGMSAANADGNIQAEELAELKLFLKEINGANPSFPEDAKQKMRQYRNNPPTLDDVIAEIRKIPNYDAAMFQNLAELIIKSDNQVTPEENTFLTNLKQAL